MTPRKKLSLETQAQVLLMCRRRCAICFGLHRDTGIKQGQIAHLDGNNSNDSPDNLAFLCLDHHDQFDSRTSQSKSLTPLEVRQFRRELHNAIEGAWREPVPIGEVQYRPVTWPGGHYIREIGNEQAELTVSVIAPSRVRVSGISLWGTDRQFGPNIGQLDFEGDLKGDTVIFEDPVASADNKTYVAVLRFRENGLSVEEKYVVGYFGMNVSFEGEYEKR